MRYVFAALSLMLFSPVHADVTFEYAEFDGTMKIHISGQNALVSAPENPPIYLIGDELHVVDMDARQYTTLTASTIQQIHERREARYNHRYVPRPGSAKTVGGYRCSTVRYEVDGENVGEFCVTSHAEMNLTDEEWMTLQRVMHALAAADGLGGDWSKAKGVVIEWSSGGATARLTRVSHDKLPRGLVRDSMPAAFRQDVYRP
ncbi:DUF4412 domain-containing protein [Ectothiorhodospiraceae bacterium 2226]|nr:DUF4412 domain-containing protein [Ectothiorhodospiraceae bacterium 2226]